MIASNYDFVLQIKHFSIIGKYFQHYLYFVGQSSQPLIELNHFRDQAVSGEVSSVYEDIPWEGWVVSNCWVF